MKLPFGHHGANHPGQGPHDGGHRDHGAEPQLRRRHRLARGVADLTHVNLNDGVCEGLAARDANAFSVQHHPEAGPGPHDSRYLFTRFADRMTGYRGGRNRQLFAETAGTRPHAQRVAENGIEPVGLPEPAAGVA